MADNKFSNWRRWGADDEIGALNLVTPETTAAAIGSVKQGKVYSLASVIRESNVPRLEFRAANQHFVRVFGGPTRDVASVADDVVIVGCHGATTHVDALCHYWTGDKLYNGFPEDTVQGRGALRLGIENVKSMVTRGVMLDVAAAKGVDYLDGGYIITRADLDECCQKQGVELRAGDVALFRTGWPRTYYESAEKYNRSQPGLTWDSGMWFCERDVCAVGSDNSAIGVRTEAPYEGANVHALFLHQAGVYLIEMMELDELSRDKVYEFLFVMAPLLVLGATGSSVNPLAIV